MEAVFWVSCALVIYTFAGYPACLAVAARWRERQSPVGDSGAFCPSVSIVLSVYNEAAVIGEKLENFLALDYPEDRLELVVISDLCSDQTEAVIRSFNSDRIRLLARSRRSGKTLNLNWGVAEARGDIVVFTDANSMFSADAIRQLVRPFRDPRVGLVSGRSIYLDSAEGNEEVGGAYRAYEEMLKAGESRVGSIVGADGAIYALRKDLYEPLRPEFINDFVHTGAVVLKGYRAVSEPKAVCREVVDETHRDEFPRQIRMMAQSWRVYFSQIGRLIRKGKFCYAWEITSHKLLRWLTLPLLALLYLANLSLIRDGYLFQAALLGQSLLWAAALAGRRLPGRLRFPYFFFLVHWAALLGLFRFFSGNAYATWNPRND